MLPAKYINSVIPYRNRCSNCDHSCYQQVRRDLIWADKPREQCGVFGITAANPGMQISKHIYFGLLALQHRGQEAAGLSVVNGTRQIYTHKDIGLVSQVLTEDILQKHWGNIGIGHVRYGTAGSSGAINAQPFFFENNMTQFALAFNGNIAELPGNSERIRSIGAGLLNQL